MSGFSSWNVDVELFFLSTSSFFIRMIDEVSPLSVPQSTSLRSYVLLLAFDSRKRVPINIGYINYDIDEVRTDLVARNVDG